MAAAWQGAAAASPSAGLWTNPSQSQPLHSKHPAQSVLVLVEKRETRYRVQWYYSLFESTMRTLNRGALCSLGAGRRAVHPLFFGQWMVCMACG